MGSSHAVSGCVRYRLQSTRVREPELAANRESRETVWESSKPRRPRFSLVCPPSTMTTARTISAASAQCSAPQPRAARKEPEPLLGKCSLGIGVTTTRQPHGTRGIRVPSPVEHCAGRYPRGEETRGQPDGRVVSLVCQKVREALLILMRLLKRKTIFDELAIHSNQVSDDSKRK